MVARLRVWLPGPVEGSSDGELEALVRATDGFRVRLEEMDEWLASDLRSVEEQIRPLRERALRAHERTGVVVGDQRRPPLRSLSRTAPRHMRRSLALI